MKVRQPSRRQLWFWWLVFIGLIIIAALLVLKIARHQKVTETNQPGLYSINHFVDGDTITVNMNGSVETVRMIGIDTPETHKPNTPVQCYGETAASYTKTLIGNSKVRLQADPLDTNRDVYGRLLRYVYLADGTFVNEKLIQNGYGFAYTYFPFEKSAEFKSHETIAKNSGRGLWSACQVRIESNGIEQTNSLSQ